MICNCRYVIASVIAVASDSEMMIGLLFCRPTAKPPYTESIAKPNAKNISSDTAAVRDRSMICGLFFSMCRKNVPHRSRYS